MTNDKRRNPSDNALKSMNKMLRVLECFSPTDRKLSASEIARRTNMPRATAHRFVSTLRDIGFLDQEKQRDEYRLGLKLFELGSRVLSSMDLHREAGPFATRLQDITGETVHLCVFNGSKMVLIDRRQIKASPSNVVTIIEEAPTYCTSVGKTTLAFQDRETINRIISDGLSPYTPNTITDAVRLRADLKVVRERGYAVDNSEHQPGIRCVGAPIRNVSGKVFAAISVSGPSRRITSRRIGSLARVVIYHANSISAQLGYRAPARRS